MKPGSLILVIALEQLPIGFSFERTRLAWPLHITVVNWFGADNSPALISSLQKEAAAIPAFQVRVGADAMFGTAQDIPVSLFVEEAPLKLLHKQMLKTVLGAGGRLTQEASLWIGDDYRPHATHHGNKRVLPGQVIDIDKICVVRMLEANKCEVLQYLELSGAGYEIPA